MTALPESMRSQERATLELRALYERFGYEKYRMSQFEEYGFYLRYRSFLPGEKILSFTDLDGRLMALKPDVTLSIIKNVRDGEPKRRVYYTETVYRENRQSGSFREIQQMGLECIGSITAYDLCETALLAARSLAAVAEERVLALGHMGYVSGLLDTLDLAPHLREAVCGAIGAKSPHLIARAAESVSGDALERMRKLCALSGPFTQTLARAEALCVNDSMAAAVEELRTVGESVAALDRGGLWLDLTLLNDTAFYDGLLFAGYVRGASRPVLSGGRYDGMMHQLGKTAGAVGFALYLSELEHLEAPPVPHESDLILRDGTDSPGALLRRAEEAVGMGKRVRVLEREEGTSC
ncbi:MAG: hypothetical protein EOM52_00105 [Clostridia bacterium]|nr:hypothetical protein [Clostridia bacterium]